MNDITPPFAPRNASNHYRWNDSPTQADVDCAIREGWVLLSFVEVDEDFEFSDSSQREKLIKDFLFKHKIKPSEWHILYSIKPGWDKDVARKGITQLLTSALERGYHSEEMLDPNGVTIDKT